MKIRILLRAIILLLASILIIGGGYYFFARDNFHSVIDGHLYRSAQLDGETLAKVIQDHGIRSIINLRGANPGKRWYDDERAVAAQYGTALYDIHLSAVELPPITDLLELTQLLQSAAPPILVHCRGGADRTGMASALALLLDGKSQLKTIRQQLSIKYFNFLPQSIGKLLLNQYAGWLAKIGSPHNTKTFITWLENDYMDANGNMRFYIDQINGVIWRTGTRHEDGYKYVIERDINPELEISGWAMDIRNQRLIKKLDIYLQDKRLGTAEYGFAYTGVAGYFGDDRYMNSGWMLRKSVLNWKPGCYDLTLEIVRLDSSVWHSSPQASVCLR